MNTNSDINDSHREGGTNSDMNDANKHRRERERWCSKYKLSIHRMKDLPFTEL